MSYLEYLLIFIIIPSLLLLAILLLMKVKNNTSVSIVQFAMSFSFLSVIAFVYTTPWDNYLVKNKIWSYDPSRILGIIWGYVPIEEYSFFILETIFVCLVVTMVFHRNSPIISGSFDFNFSKTKILTLGSITIIWFICLFSFIQHIESMLYFNLLLLWALPPIFFQLLIGWDILSSNRSKIITIILLMGTYLSFTDAYAIYSGIWFINKEYTMGVVLFSLPIEEALFFFLTVALILFGHILSSYFYHKYVIIIKSRSQKVPSYNI